MNTVVVGCGTAVPEADRACSGYWVDSGGQRFLLDCGPGIVHGLAALDLAWSQLDVLVLSHFHNDHIGDVPYLFFALRHGTTERRTKPLKVIGPAGTSDLLEGMTRIFGGHVRNPGFAVRVQELSPNSGVEYDEGLRVSCRKTPHTEESLAYRIDGPAGSLGYTGDTGPDATLGKFFEGVDLLIAECALPDDEAIPTHLSPASAADLTVAAAPGALLATHLYPRLARRDPAALLARAGWQGRTIIAHVGYRHTFDASR